MNKIKKAILKVILSERQLQKLYANTIKFPGGLRPITDTKDEDVFIVGFPKSGNTLLNHIVAHLVYELNENASRSLINLIVPDIYANSHYFRFNDRCFFKSHDLPKPHHRKVIYIMRDGRDALISYHRMVKNMGNEVSLKGLYLGNVKLFGATWQEHIIKWEENPYNAEILWVKFEDLRTNKTREILRICDFLGLTKENKDLEKVEVYTSLQHMRALEKREDWQKMNRDYKFNKGSFVGEGKINSYKNGVPKRYLDKFEELNKETLNKYYYP